MVTVSAPGKIHFIGEHAVIYGKPAILAAIGLRTYVGAEKSESVEYCDKRFDTEILRYDLQEIKRTAQETRSIWEECKEKENFSDLFRFIKTDRYSNYRKAVIGLAAEKLKIEKGISVTIGGDLPVGSGLGSSASLSVALPYAISVAHGKKETRERINDIAFELEKIIHGTPSGGDNSVCCYGGLIWFEKAAPKNKIISLKDEIPDRLKDFLIVYVGDSNRPTGEMVQQVRDLNQNFRDSIIDSIGSLTREMREALARRNYENVREIMNKSQKNLAKLTVSTKEIDKVCSAAIELGGGAKLCGAGGGGAVLCYSSDIEKLKKTMDEMGYRYWETELAAEGLRAEGPGL